MLLGQLPFGAAEGWRNVEGVSLSVVWDWLVLLLKRWFLIL